MTKTNQLLPNTNEPQENFVALGNNFAFHPPKNKSRRWKNTQPDIQKQCFIGNEKFVIKYNLPRQQYSQKNNWGYWTGKEADQKKYICNTCLVKILNGKKFAVNDWVENEAKAGHFYAYLSRGNFKES